MTRPSEALTAYIGSIIGAVFTLLTVLGIKIPDGIDGPVIILVSFIASGVTFYISRRQGRGELGSSSTGEVTH